MSLGQIRELNVGQQTYRFHDVSELVAPLTVGILAENLIRHGGDPAQIEALATWGPDADLSREIEFVPARVVMQDFTGVPCVVDLATMREAVRDLGGDPELVNPRVPTQLVIDHSVVADEFGSPRAFARNVDWEFQRNQERYRFLKWGQQAFRNFHVVPPDTGIVHQVNIEHLAPVVMTDPESALAFPDSCVGTDSHTTMVSGLGVLGWGVGGIEAEAAMLGQPISMTLPCVVGVELTGHLMPGVTATDLVLTIAQRLRAHGVVGKFVEFYGPGAEQLAVETRATLSNMSPEYGATTCLFPVDARTIDYLTMTGRDPAQVELVEAYAKAQGWWGQRGPVAYSESMRIDLGEVVPSIAGPRRPQDRIDLANAADAFQKSLSEGGFTPVSVDSPLGELRSGLVAVAAITSCTNTSNPRVMIAAGLLAKKAVEAGLTVKPWVKTTLSPGSKVVTDYLAATGLAPYLEQLGFYLAGYGCMTCIGNAGPVIDEVKQATDQGLVATAVLSGNRNFEGRISPDIRFNYLASPPLVVAYALAGTMEVDLTSEPVGVGKGGEPVFLKDIWPSDDEITAAASAVNQEMFARRYAEVFSGSDRWQELSSPATSQYEWTDSTYIRRAPYFDQMGAQPAPLGDVRSARILLLLGDSVTTDHISPAGAIKPDSPAGLWLAGQGVAVADFNSYGSRRGNHEVMVRGTFANIRLRNLMVPGVEGGFTKDFTHPGAPLTTVFDAAQAYRAQGVPLVVVAGQEYGTGSSRDWAAKGSALLGVRAVLAQSFERIHRSNLIGMGILPLQFLDGESAASWGLTGAETISVEGLDNCGDGPLPRRVDVVVDSRRFQAVVRVDTPTEARYLRQGGILPYQVRVLAGVVCP